MENRELIALTDQKGRRIVVFDLQEKEWSDKTLVWEWKSDKESFVNVSDVKLRYSDLYGGQVMIVCASRGYAAIVGYPSGEILWQTEMRGNLHAVELLPDGNLAIAASTGNLFRIYASSCGSQDFTEVPFPDTHGSVWDPQRQVLWVLGESRLSAYTVEGTRQQPVIKENPELSAVIPPEFGYHGHDLAPVYHHPDLLWVTTVGGVCQYHKSTGLFSRSYSNCAEINRNGTQGIGNTPFTDTVVTVRTGNVFLPWCADTVNLIYSDGRTRTIQSGTDAYYKSRVFYDKYQ